jgi:hypothetical protein
MAEVETEDCRKDSAETATYLRSRVGYFERDLNPNYSGTYMAYSHLRGKFRAVYHLESGKWSSAFPVDAWLIEADYVERLIVEFCEGASRGTDSPSSL